MGRITRNPEEAANKKYDLIIIGGGIYGVTLALEASRAGLRSLLVEKSDFGGGTSFNSLRILHGGLRYLQSLNLNRFQESVAERSWFLRTFPELIRIMPCLMPLYGKGAKRPSIFWAALQLNDFLSRNRNWNVRPDRHLPRGRVISVAETKKLFPDVDSSGLKGGAVWYDVAMPDSQRLLMEVLRWACELGSTALNYVAACDILKEGNCVTGIRAIDQQNGASLEFRGDVVVNAAGPWCRQLATDFDRDIPRLFRASLAWNVLFDSPSLSDHALAVAPKKPGGRIYFLVPWKGRLMAGTGHANWSDNSNEPAPSNEQMVDFINDLNLAIPTLALSERDVGHVFSGLLPATDNHSAQISTQEEIVIHADHGGPLGLYSISGVKFTTARLVAEKTMQIVFPQSKLLDKVDIISPPSTDLIGKRGLFAKAKDPGLSGEKERQMLKELIEEESVLRADDLIYRRSNLWEYPEQKDHLLTVIESLIDK